MELATFYSLDRISNWKLKTENFFESKKVGKKKSNGVVHLYCLKSRESIIYLQKELAKASDKTF